jgi:ABC-type dipeptide/oligopeptide/nickel transport system permease component
VKQILTMVAARIALGAATLLVVSVVIFLCMALLPGDFATEVLGQDATPDVKRLPKLTPNRRPILTPLM